MADFERQLELLITGPIDPAKNYAKEIAILIHKQENQKLAMDIVENIVDYGFFNMIMDEYNYYFMKKIKYPHVYGNL